MAARRGGSGWHAAAQKQTRKCGFIPSVERRGRWLSPGGGETELSGFWHPACSLKSSIMAGRAYRREIAYERIIFPCTRCKFGREPFPVHVKAGQTEEVSLSWAHVE